MKLKTVAIWVGAVVLLIVAVVAILTILGPQLNETDFKTCPVVGCEDGFALNFTGSVPADYSVEATGSQGDHIAITCHPVTDKSSRANCLPDGVKIRTASPEVTVTVRWTGGSKTQVFKPEYHSWQPNGPDCPPICAIGDALTMSLP